MIHSVVHLRGAVALILLHLSLSSSYVADAGAADFTAGMEAGHGVHHNDARLRIFITRYIALAYTHYSNAGYEHPNRGYNFVSLEFLLQ